MTRDEALALFKRAEAKVTFSRNGVDVTSAVIGGSWGCTSGTVEGAADMLKARLRDEAARFDRLAGTVTFVDVVLPLSPPSCSSRCTPFVHFPPDGNANNPGPIGAHARHFFGRSSAPIGGGL